MVQQFLLFENASGYAIFEVVESDGVALTKASLLASPLDLQTFSKVIKLKGFSPFTSAENALSNCNDVSEGLLSEDLSALLSSSLPSSSKSKKFSVGVADPKIGSAIQDTLGFPCATSDVITELLRACRTHAATVIPALSAAVPLPGGLLGHGVLEKAQLGLAHAYSRAKVKFNVNRSDNMIIQAIALLDGLDKDLNTFAMRVREWYGWHFPELGRIVKDNFMYARVARFIGSRSTLNDEKLEELTKLCLDEEETAKAILDAAKISMGMDISDTDLANVDQFTGRLVSLAQYRQNLSEYLASKMHVVAPNLAALIGDVVGARLISHAGSLTNLAKSPASTVQILGAEKALFRALKTKGNTPKYGLIFHSSFIGRAAAKNKGRISRYLANKCAIAARIDSFSDIITTKYGEKMKDQVEDRLKFFETGEPAKKNTEVMHGVMEELRAEGLLGPADSAYKADGNGEKKAKKAKKEKKRGDDDEEEEGPASTRASTSGVGSKRGRAEIDEDEEEAEVEAPKSSKKDKKEKKEKKEKKSKRARTDDSDDE